MSKVPVLGSLSLPDLFTDIDITTANIFSQNSTFTTGNLRMCACGRSERNEFQANFLCHETACFPPHALSVNKIKEDGNVGLYNENSRATPYAIWTIQLLEGAP